MSGGADINSRNDEGEKMTLQAAADRARACARDYGLHLRQALAAAWQTRPKQKLLSILTDDVRQALSLTISTKSRVRLAQDRIANTA
jgi:hypothetical protein